MTVRTHFRALALAVLALVSAPAAAQDLEQKAKDLRKELATSGDAKARARAAEELGKIGQLKASYARPAVPDLIKAMKDTDAGLRAAAALALGRVDPDPKVGVPPLVELLKDKELSVRTAAANGLAAMGPAAKEALPALRAAMKKDREQKRAVRSYRTAIKVISGKN
ncbi:MAG TPA: HEAT repeat domain-containing protein [Gemmataceae bacterium]